MAESPNARPIFILTGATDEQYRVTRPDQPSICTSAGKRHILYKAIQEASGSPVIIVTPPPPATDGKKPIPHAPTETRFGEFPQFISRAYAVRKLRYILDIVSFVKLVWNSTEDGSTIIFDNYELRSVAALHYCRLKGRKNPVVLEYEDGRHAIDRGLWWVFSMTAELLGRNLVDAAILAAPALAHRLPRKAGYELVPGILKADRPAPVPLLKDKPVRFLYSGSLDEERGLPLFIDYLESPHLHPHAEFHITGKGIYQNHLRDLAKRLEGKVFFHGLVTEAELADLRRSCHYGVNLQRSGNPISEVTYPSKTFDYMNAGLRIVTTKAAQVESILGDSALYVDEETKEGLAVGIRRAIEKADSHQSPENAAAMDAYTYRGTVERLKRLLGAIESKRSETIRGTPCESPFSPLTTEST